MENAVRVFCAAEDYFQDDLCAAARQAILDAFARVSVSQDWAMLSHEAVVSLLSDDNLQAAQELAVFDAAVRWCKANACVPPESATDIEAEPSSQPTACSAMDMGSDNPTTGSSPLPLQAPASSLGTASSTAAPYTLHTHDRARASALLATLLPAVRLRLVPADTLTAHVLGHPLVQSDAACQDCVRQVLAGPAPTPRGRLCLALFCGHEAEGLADTLLTYDLRNQTWTSHGPGASAPRPRLHAAAAATPDGSIFVFGGLDSTKQPILIGERRVSGLGEWQTTAPMPHAAVGAQCVYLRGKLYVLGGSRTALYSCSNVLCYDIASDTWSEAPPMLTARRFHAAAVARDKILVAGGRDRGRSMKSCELFDPDTNTWSPSPPMQCARAYFGAAALAAGVCVVGGENDSDDSDQLGSVEIFDFARGSWSAYPPLSVPRAFFTLITSDEVLFVLGGMQPTPPEGSANAIRLCPLAEVEYCPDRSKWAHGVPLPAGRSSACGVLVRVVPRSPPGDGQS